MKPSRIVLLLIALIAGGLAAYLATRGSGPAPEVQQVVVQQQAAPAAQVLVAKGAVGVGQRLSAATVEWQAWPESAVRPEYITIAKTPDAPAKMSGTVARFEIFPGEPISDAKLAHSDQGFLSAVLDQGMRGVSVTISAASGSGGFIIPNDRVDVVVTDNTTGQTASRVILSDVKVLAIGTRLGQSGTTGSPADPTDPKSQIFTSDSIATLELTPSQAEALITATATGKISLVLRSVADFGKVGPVVEDTATGNSQTVRIIRFGRQVNVTPGSASQPGSQASVNPAAFTTPAPTPAPAGEAPPVVVTTTTTAPAVATPSPAPAPVVTTTSPPASTQPPMAPTIQ